MPQIVGTPNNDVLTRTVPETDLYGLEGDDTLTGEGGTLDGGEGDDIVYNYSHGATVLGGAGDDSISNGQSGWDFYADGGDGNDTISTEDGEVYGGNGNDHIHSWWGPTTVSGGDGNDTLIGSTANATLYGDAGDDLITQAAMAYGGDGDDTIGPHFQTATGGAGRDRFILGLGNGVITDFVAGAGGETISLEFFTQGLSPAYDPFLWEFTLRQWGDDVQVLSGPAIDGWRSIALLKDTEIDDLTPENFMGYNPSTIMRSNSNNDTLMGSKFRDLIQAFNGAHVVDGGGGNDTIWGDYNDYWIHSEVRPEVDNDTLSGGAGDDYINGVWGTDLIDGGDGNDTLSSGHDVHGDTLSGGAGSDSLEGSRSDDVLNGGSRWDTLIGGEGHDTLDGGLDNDRMWGGAGNDLYYVDHVGDRVYEVSGQGTDTVKSSISYALTPDVEILNLTGIGNIDGTGNGLSNSINGNSGNNLLKGGLGNDSLYGWEGNDTLEGGNDHDRLSGGNGSDTLTGGHGNDVLGGGAGADLFVFSGLTVNGHDHIVDFAHGLDRLVFSGADYGFASGHILTAAQFTAGTAAVGSGAQFVWNSAGQRLYFDADGAGGAAATELALISGGVTLTSDDLVFV